MTAREQIIREAVTQGLIPPIEDIRFLLFILDSARAQQYHDPLVRAVTTAYGPEFVDPIIHAMWEYVRESVGEHIES